MARHLPLPGTLPTDDQTGTDVATPPRPRGVGDNILPARAEELLRASVREIWRRRRAIEREQRAIKGVYDAARAAGLRPATVKQVIGRLEMESERLEETLQREAERDLYWSLVEDLRAELTAGAGAED
jgi:hypothetical protein